MQGVQVFDENGDLDLTIGQRTGRIIGSVNTGTSDGSYYNGAFLEGKPFSTTISNDSTTLQFDIYAPGVSFSGASLNWVFDASTAPARRRSVTIVFGVA